MKVAVVGATGLVGREMLKVLDEFSFPVSEFIPVASVASAGKKLAFRGKEYALYRMEEALAKKPDLALFSAGGSVSKEFAPKFVEIGCTVVDNSSAWRMEPGIALVVPEINLHTAKRGALIANPNCSTIQMVLALAPLHKAFSIKRVVVSTYQSVSGTGKNAVQQLRDERAGISGPKVYPHTIDLNCIPQCDVFMENGYTKEEMKMLNETRKILGDESIQLTSTTVRVPVTGGHSESVNVEFNKPFEIAEVIRLLENSAGIVVMDDPTHSVYPTPLFAQGKNEVFVGRIRRDSSIMNGLNLWIVADNLRKGAATNAVQIAMGIFNVPIG